MEIGKTHEQVAPNVSRKGKEKVDEPPMVLDASTGHSIMGENSSGSEMSLDDELGIPIMQTLGVKKAMETMNAKLRRSTRLKNPM